MIEIASLFPHWASTRDELAHTYGRQWIALSSHGEPRKDSALAVNAISLNLGSTKKA